MKNREIDIDTEEGRRRFVERLAEVAPSEPSRLHRFAAALALGAEPDDAAKTAGGTGRPGT